MTTTVAIGHPAPDTSRAPGAALNRALNFDVTRPVAFAVLAIAYIASRAPFVNIGYGTDPDAWRVALGGYWLWDHGEYYPSRLPGYPLPELASAAVIKGGAVATNLLVVLVSLAGVWLFARIARDLEIPHRFLIVIGFAFAPLLWINSMTTMDYMWALTFVLGAYYFLIRERNIVAGVFVGLAAASRSTSILMLLPFALYLWRDGKRDDILRFGAIAIAVAAVAYTPVVWAYGFRFLNFYDSKVGYLNVLRLLGKDCLGLIGAIGVLVAIGLSAKRLARLPADVVADKHTAVWVLAMALTVAVFLRLPHESAYLIPLYPFGFLLMAKYFQRWVLAGVVSAILLAGFVDLTSPGEDITTEAFTHARLGEGLVLSNRDTMRAQISFSHELEQLNIPDNTVVMTGFIYPQFAVLNRHRLELGVLEKDESSISQLSDKGKATDRQHNIVYSWLLDFEDFERFRNEGYDFMYTQDAGRSTAALYKFRPGLYGATVIDLGRGPSGGRGAARTAR